MIDKQIEELLPLYALGGLSAEEQAEVEAYLATHKDSRTILAEMMTTVELLPYEVNPVIPSPQVKSILTAKVRRDLRQQQVGKKTVPHPTPNSFWQRLWETFRWRWGMPALTTLTTVTLLLTLLWAQSLWRRNQTLRQELLAQETVIAQLETDSQVANLLHLPKHIITIVGTNHRPQAIAQLITDQSETSAVLVVDRLDSLDEHSTYQLWFIRGETPHAAGLFTVNLQGNGVWLVNSETPITSFDAIGVSIEPASGSLQPTGNIILLGELKKG